MYISDVYVCTMYTKYLYYCHQFCLAQILAVMRQWSVTHTQC